jgi:hypothetical protein
VCNAFVSVSVAGQFFKLSQIIFEKCDRVGKGKGRKTLPVDNGCTKSIKRRLK